MQAPQLNQPTALAPASGVETIALGGDDPEDEDIFASADDSADVLEPSGQRASGSGADAAEGEPMRHEQTPERADLIRKITAYKRRFPDECRLVQIEALAFMDDTALDTYCDDVRFNVSQRNSNNMISKSIDLAIIGAETLSKPYFPAMEGYYKEVSAQQAYRDCCDEIAIEFGGLSYVKPEVRLMFILAGAAIPRLQGKPAPAAVDPAKQKKYADL